MSLSIAFLPRIKQCVQPVNWKALLLTRPSSRTEPRRESKVQSLSLTGRKTRQADHCSLMMLTFLTCFLDIELANLRLANSPDIHIRKTQAAQLKEKFLKALRRYQSSESDARKKYQGRMERQIKIGKACWTLDHSDKQVG